MFVIAAIIWGFVLIKVIRNARKKDKGFFARYRTDLIAIVAALVLTLFDIWVFVAYIPTHFKKHPVVDTSVSASELLSDSTLQDSANKPVGMIGKKDSVVQHTTVAAPITKTILLTNKASVRFFSHGADEDIEATNHSVACSLNKETGQVRFNGLVKGFVFENEIMQDHFNDTKYMNSEVFPKTGFTGTLQNIASVIFTKDGKYPVTAAGALTIHGITKNITAPGSITVKAGKFTLKSVFFIKRLDFGITTDEIADELEITVIAGF